MATTDVSQGIISQQMSQDWMNALTPGAPSVSWGGGTMGAADSSGSRVYTDGAGKQQTINGTTDMTKFAQDNPGVAAQWNSQYGYVAAPKAVQAPTPQKVVVTPDQTVQGQMSSMIDPNNPYYQKWASAGAEDAAARGFTGNDSMRNTGILNSVMQNAAPIASTDAGTYSRAATDFVDTSNQVAMANVAAQNQLIQSGIQANTSKYAADTSANTSRYTADTSAATQLGVTGMNNTTALAQSNIAASTQLAVSKMTTESQAAVSAAHDANSTLIASNGQAQTTYNYYVNAIAAIDQNTAMDENAKRAAIDTQTQVFNTAINGIKATTPGTTAATSPLSTVSAETASAAESAKAAAASAAAAAATVDVRSQVNFGGGSCFPSGSFVLMANGAQKDISQIQIGERVQSADGNTATVTGLMLPKLGLRKLVAFDNGLCRTSFEHSLWSRSMEYGKQWWSTRNMQEWMKEAANGDGPTFGGVFPHDLTDRYAEPWQFAHVDGWRMHTTQIIEASPDTQLYHLLVDGAQSYFVDGYLVSSMADVDTFDWHHFNWTGLSMWRKAVNFVRGMFQ